MKQDLPSRIVSSLLPRIQDALFICILVIVCVRGSALFNADGDLGRHITIGKSVLANGIPFYDIFSHTMAGQYMVSHEWVAQILFAAAHQLMGLSGDVLLTAILIATTFTLVFREMRRRGIQYLPATLFTVLGAFASIIHWLSRPHVFTFLFVAMWTFNLQKTAEGKGNNNIAIFPLLMLLWANAHGAFITGFVILFAYLAGWGWEYLTETADTSLGKKLALIGILSFAVTFINPYGWHLWETSVGYFGNDFLVDYTVEYQSPDFHEFSGLPFMLLLMLALVAPALGRKLRAHEAFLLAGWSALALYSERNIPLFAIITAPYLGYMFQPVFDKIALSDRVEQAITGVEKQLSTNPFVLPVLASILVGFLMIRGYPIDSTGLNYQYDPEKFPVEAADWLEAYPQDGKMFNQFGWGGYILYRLWPQQTVFIDGQTDFYGEALTLDYVAVTYLREGWQDVLTEYDVDWALIGANETALSGALQSELGWNLLYEDETSIILRRP